VTAPVSPPSPADRAWADLGAELTPAKSLARVDAVTARAITTITVVGVLLTGLGAVTAGLLTHNGAARVLAAVTVLIAAAAVACALTAQVLTITRHLNPADLTQVQAWYQRQFRTRAYPTQAATLLLLTAALLAGATAATALTATPATTPAVTVTQSLPLPRPGNSTRQVTVTVQVTFPGLDTGQAATVVATTAGRILARAAATPGSDGTATVTLTLSHLTPKQPVIVTARAPHQPCQATLVPARIQPVLTCHTH
jgi:hypothetical protein